MLFTTYHTYLYFNFLIYYWSVIPVDLIKLIQLSQLGSHSNNKLENESIEINSIKSTGITLR